MKLRKTAIGIEFGTTRIKAVMIDRNHRVIASGQHKWENRLIDGIWTYTLDDIETGLQACFADLKKDFAEKFQKEITTTGALGISAMMHGYISLDARGEMQVPYRTWRNSMTEEASGKLTELFGFHIPQRWTIAHLYQAILNKEPHVEAICHLTTLAGYVHWRLTGERYVGLGEASGILPLDQTTMDYDDEMIRIFEQCISDRNYPWKVRDILPKGVAAGGDAGTLTPSGARFLDPAGVLQPGIPLAPCEGDADTGMVATNSIRPGVGNVSAGTSAFFTIVSRHPLGVHREVDLFCSSSGYLTAMVHSSNCTSDINAWIRMFSEFAKMIGSPMEEADLYTMLFSAAMDGDPDAGGLLNFNFYSGESIPRMLEGRPLFVRRPDAVFNLANFMRSCLMSSLSTMKIGMDILIEQEKVEIDHVFAHGGFFKTPEAGQRILSAAIGRPVTVMETAGEGGPYGMALLCAYKLWRSEGESLEDYIGQRVFRDASLRIVSADPAEMEGFDTYLKRYRAGLDIERLAVEVF